MATYIEKTALASEMQTLEDKASAQCGKYHALAENDSWQKAIQAYRTICDAIKAIEALPTVEAETVRHGRWIKASTTPYRKENIYKCSVCNNYLDFDGVNAGRGDVNYCPNCGADMRGREE